MPTTTAQGGRKLQPDPRWPQDNRHGDELTAAADVNRIDWNAAQAEGAVKVQVEKAVISLTGAVALQFQRRSAEDAIRFPQAVTGKATQIGIQISITPAEPEPIAAEGHDGHPTDQNDADLSRGIHASP